MDILYTAMSVLILAPWLALGPAVMFGWWYRRKRRGLVLTAAVAWLLYAVYESGMALRWWCTGECNIRVDLLLVYPALLLLSLAAVVSALRQRSAS